MEVQSHSAKNLAPKKKAPSPDEIKAKIKEKFGKDLTKPKPKALPEEQVELNSKKGVTNSNEENFGDIGKNDPNSEETQQKLREILKSGAFHFNDKERKTLSNILK